MSRIAPSFAAVLLALGLAAAVQAQEPAISRQVLPNGLTVLVREDAAAGVVAMSLQVRAGSRFESPTTTGITNFLHRAMLRGTSKRTAVQLATSYEDIGGAPPSTREGQSARGKGAGLARPP